MGVKYLDVLNEKGESTGKVLSKQEIHEKGLWHESIHVWIVNKNNELLVQKRTSTKKIRPDTWTCSCAGHLISGESLEKSARKQIENELGFSLNSVANKFRYKQQVTQTTTEGEVLINNEFVNVLVFFEDVSIQSLNMNKKEISEIKYCKLSELRNIFIQDQELSILNDLLDKVILKKKYKTPFGIFDEVVLENEPALRMVLTERCNLNCEFCIYKKGNFSSPEINSESMIDFSYSEDLIKMLNDFREKFHYNTIHLTGGEPTLCKDLMEICIKLKENNFKINIVTNLIDVDVIKELYKLNCIDELTFSYTPLDKNNEIRTELIKNYKTVDPNRNNLIKKSVLMLKQNYDTTIKTNVVCSGLTDINDALNFIKWCWENGIEPRMQRDRSNGRIKGSTETVKKILNELKVKKKNITIRVPGATEICNYEDAKGNKLTVKVFNQNFRFQKVCEQCNEKNKCTKAISSIRFFNKKEGHVFCFCNAKDENYTVLTKGDLYKSPVLDSILHYKINKEEYFNDFCIKPDHQ